MKIMRIILSLAWAALFIWGITGVWHRFFGGRDLANYSSYIPWGLWVSTYIYFIGISAGAFLISSLIYVFGIARLKKIGRIALFTAVVSLGMALLSISFDLGHMWRSYEVFTRPNFTSMMAWMVWLYSAYFLLILGELWFELRCDLARLAKKDGKIAPLYRILSLGWKYPESKEALAVAQVQSARGLKILSSLGIPLAIAFHGGVGALFATLASRPYWHSGLFPVLFLTGALVSGGALLLALVALFDIVPEKERKSIQLFLGRLVIGLLLFDLVLEWAEFSIPMWYGIGHEYQLLRQVLFGEYWYVFWVVHLLLGSLVPLALLLWKPTSRLVGIFSGGLIALTFLAVRLNFVIPAQITPALKGIEEAYVDKRLVFEYMPSAFEWSVVAFIVAGGLMLFYLGLELLPLTENGKERQVA